MKSSHAKRLLLWISRIRNLSGQPRGKMIARRLRPHEHQRLLSRMLLKQVHQQIRLARTSSGVNVVLHRLDHLSVVRTDLNELRVVHKRARQRLHSLRVRSGPESGLLAVRHHAHQVLNVGEESQVKHAIALVQNHVIHLRQVYGTLGNEIHETTGSSNEDMRTGGQLLVLRTRRDTTVKTRRETALHVFTILMDGRSDLFSQFTSRTEDNHLHTTIVLRRQRLLNQLHKGKRKGRSLTRTSTRASNQITTGKKDGYRLLLNLRGRLVACLGHSARKLSNQTKLGKGINLGNRTRRIGRSCRHGKEEEICFNRVSQLWIAFSYLSPQN